MRSEHLKRLLEISVALRIAHWQADTRTNEHAALGVLYESVDSGLDELAEVSMGKSGSTDVAGEVVKAGAVVPELDSEIQSILAELGPEDEDLRNIAADMQIALNMARYLLKV